MNSTRKVYAVLAAGAIAALAGCASTGGQHAATVARPKTTAPSSQPSTPAPVPSPAATYQGSCDYTLAGSPYQDDHLIGEVNVTNTGNIGVALHVRISWPQEGYGPVTARKVVTVKAGATKAVRFHVSAGSIAGNSQVITLLQSYQDSHNGTGCTYKATIVSTYGQAG